MEPDLWFLYRQMLRSRLFEERVMKLWEEGKISGEMHLGLGEEAIAAGIVSHLQNGDAMALDHRGTPPLVMRGVDLVTLVKEFLGHSDGLCGGFGGHMHLFSPEFLSASSGIVGESGPMAAGFAIAAQCLRPGKIAVAFFGEGAMNQGMLLESMNLAVIWKLPMLFVCKDNEMAITTQSPSVTGGNLIERANGFGMHAMEVDGTDAEEVWEASREAVEKIRRDEGPIFMLAHCSHLEGHFLGDPLFRIVRNPIKQMKEILGLLVRALISKKGATKSERLRRIGELISLIRRGTFSQKEKRHDPLSRMYEKLSQDRLRLEQMKGEIKKEIDEAMKKALSSEEKSEGRIE